MGGQLAEADSGGTEKARSRVNPALSRLIRHLERVAVVRRVIHIMYVKRPTLVLNEEILEEATRLSGEKMPGEKTFSAAVIKALEDFVRRARARQILELRGTGTWEGDLREMRGDPAP